MTNPNEAAGVIPPLVINNQITYWSDGLTKREYFAALALQGFCAHHGINYGTHFLANHAVDAADLLILELNRGQE